MDRLPLELLLFIVKTVGHESLISLRLVNKALAAAAAPFLFEVIPLWIGVRSLERLTAISEHPQISQYPKKIIFSPLRIIDYDYDGAYECKVKGMLKYQSASLRMHALTLAKHKSAYRSFIEMQRLLSSTALDIEVLSKAFSHLPHLETLHVDISDTRIGSAELIHAFGTFKAEDLVTYDCRYTLPVLIEALAASAIKIKIFKLSSDGDYSGSIISGSVGDCVWSLEIVSLEGLCSPNPMFQLRATLDSVMPFCMFYNIKELNIHNYNVTVAGLCDVFRRNRYTIAKADFRDVAITGSDWSTALIQLRTLDLLRLEVFVLSSYKPEKETGLQVQDYILKKTDKDPVAEEEEWLKRLVEQKENEP